MAVSLRYSHTSRNKPEPFKPDVSGFQSLYSTPEGVAGTGEAGNSLMEGGNVGDAAPDATTAPGTTDVAGLEGMVNATNLSSLTPAALGVKGFNLLSGLLSPISPVSLVTNLAGLMGPSQLHAAQTLQNTQNVAQDQSMSLSPNSTSDASLAGLAGLSPSSFSLSSPNGITAQGPTLNGITAADMGIQGLGVNGQSIASSLNQASSSPTLGLDSFSISSPNASGLGYSGNLAPTIDLEPNISNSTGTAGVGVSGGDGTGGAPGGTGPGGVGDGASAGGPGGEAPHTGGYIAGPAMGQRPGGFSDPGMTEAVRALLAVKQLITASGLGKAGLGGRRGRNPNDLTDGGEQTGLASAGGVTGTAPALGGGGGDFASIPIDSGIPVPEATTGGDGAGAGAPSGDAGTGTGTGGDAGGGVGDGAAPGGDAPGDAGGASGAFHTGGYVGDQDPMQGDVLARLQPGEFVVPRGPMAEMLRQQNPGLTKYGGMLTKSPIKNVMNPQTAMLDPMGLIGAILPMLGGAAGRAMQGGYQDVGAPDGGPIRPEGGNTKTPSAEQQEPEAPAVRAERGMQKLKRLQIDFDVPPLSGDAAR